MSRPYDVVTFDCYGTLIDWETGIAEAFVRAAGADGVSVDPAAVIAAHWRHEPEIQAAGYLPYREVLADVARRIARELGWRMKDDGKFLADSLPGWTPFPDTNPALERLAGAGYALGILSNIDDDLIARTRRHFTVPFEIVVTAAQVRSYKPALGHWQTARPLVGDRRWLHAAQSYFHDVIPARGLGLATAWVNRKHERSLDGGKADVEVPTMAALADALCEP